MNLNAKRWLSALSIVLALGATTMPSMAQHAWDLTSASPDSNFLVQGAQDFARRVEEETQGQVVITVHSGSALGIKGPESMQAVKDGIVTMAEFSFDQQVSATPLAFVTGAPGLAMGFAENAQLRDTLRVILDEQSAELNQKVLYMAPWPGQGIFTKTPIDSVDDLKTLKIRAGSSSAYDFLEILGAAPVLMPWAEVTPALATGAIEGVATSSQSGVDGKFWEFLNRYYALDYSNPMSTITVNLDAWNALSPDLQETVMKVAAEVEPEVWARAEEEDNKARATLTENGVEVIIPSAEFKADVLERSTELRDDAMARSGEAGARLAASVIR